VFFTTSAFTVLPRLVDAEQLPRANGLFETSQWVVQVVGASLAALTLATAGAATAFVLDAGSFLASALLLVRLRTLLAGAPTAGTDGDSAGGGWRSFVAGVRLIVRTPRIRVLLLASYGVTFLAACTNFTLIFLVSESLGQGAAALGLLYSVNGAVAVAAAAATTAWLRPALLGRAMALAMTGLCAAQVVMGLAPNLWVLGLGVAVSALANAPYNVAVTTLYMTRVPPQYLGRVEGVDTVVDNAVTIAAFGLSLWVVGVADPRAVFVLSALVAAPSLLLAAVRLGPRDRLGA
jgi:hypothetical protein